MKIIESLKIKEKEYIEKLDNGMTVIIIPKPNLEKKYIIWGTKFGSIDNRFIARDSEEVIIPDGVAHFLEHKMFEQPDGTNSLDTLMALGLDANAYTTNDHTAYLFECTENFYEGLDELMNYVQHPYFTQENVEKEKGIISQEIKMYDDEPAWRLYMNAMDCMYEKNPIKIDIAGSVESIKKITPDILYKCYNTFYNPSNMIMVICGNFEPEKIIEEIKNRLVSTKEEQQIKRIYPEKESKINKKFKEIEMEVSIPLFAIGFRDFIEEYNTEEIVKKHIAIEILLNMIIGESSETYKELYGKGNLISEPDMDYEFSKEYAHILISGRSKEPNAVREKIEETINKYLNNGLDEKHFNRIKKKIYGNYVSEYNSVGDIARMFLADKIKDIDSFDYIEKYNCVTKEYTESVLKNVFKTDNMVMSVVRNKK